MKIKRGYYNEINMYTLSPRMKKIATNLVKLASKANKVDEHGSWDFRCEFDANGRGSALNWDLYGIAKDYHSRRWLIVIQVREWYKRTRNGFARIRKNYFLIGRNEDNSVFAHPISGRKIHAAIKAGKCPVYAAQCWIFGTDYAKVLRQGDIAFVPVNQKASDSWDSGNRMLLGSHSLTFGFGRVIDGYMLISWFRCEHATHPTVSDNTTRVYKVVVGRRSEYWKFAAPTAD